MQYCDKCGGPLRSNRYGEWCNICLLLDRSDDWCRHLEWHGEMIDDGVRWHGDADRMYAEWGDRQDAANSTADSPATSTWLPDGAFEPITAQHRGTPPANPEAWRLRHWLSSTAHRDTNPLRTRQVNNGRRVFLRHYSAQPPHPWAIMHHGVTVE